MTHSLVTDALVAKALAAANTITLDDLPTAWARAMAATLLRNKEILP